MLISSFVTTWNQEDGRGQGSTAGKELKGKGVSVLFETEQIPREFIIIRKTWTWIFTALVFSPTRTAAAPDEEDSANFKKIPCKLKTDLYVSRFPRDDLPPWPLGPRDIVKEVGMGKGWEGRWSNQNHKSHFMCCGIIWKLIPESHKTTPYIRSYLWCNSDPRYLHS